MAQVHVEFGFVKNVGRYCLDPLSALSHVPGNTPQSGHAVHLKEVE